ncbi:hypothetical protein [Janibacter hoylei]|uniref:hypothetical protein n=1 Tax=Janibacter hoylei TaxID=364298 RepID=UPI0021A2AB04|nr:hypothetical protein [Janibacter hoylei]MCT1619211.1 hypothetical protein [Janibacter hoylei]MCT2293396.1 hypothetical protein [Janibacter hoylei]MCW4601280.1 hypothetical protein [Janibacter hoylei]
MRTSRRAVLLGALILPVAACGRRSDVPAVQAALRSAVEALPEHVAGLVQYQDSTSAGTTISGVLTLQGSDRAAVTASLERVLEAVARTYRDQADVRTAFVRLEAHPADDPATRVLTTEVVAPSEDANTTTDDLDAHFDL